MLKLRMHPILPVQKSKRASPRRSQKRRRETLSTGFQPQQSDTSSGFRISRIVAPSRFSPVASGMPLRHPSPITAAGPPRNCTVFRFIESGPIIRLAARRAIT
jgi:hypothetical protein